MSEIVAKADGLDSVTRARMEGHISALQDALGRWVVRKQPAPSLLHPAVT
jgi:hypothetical protein